MGRAVDRRRLLGTGGRQGRPRCAARWTATAPLRCALRRALGVTTRHGEPALRLLDEVGVTRASVLRSEEVPGSPRQGSPANAFDLRPLNEAYRAFAERYEPLLDSVRAGRIGPAEALLTRTGLRVDWRDFPETDPDLPTPLLPADWARPRARRCFTEIYDLLGPLAELRFRQIIAVSDPELAELASHHDSATVARLHAELGNGSARGDTPFERAAEARRLAGVLPGRKRREHDQ